MSGNDAFDSLDHRIKQAEEGNVVPVTQPEALSELVALIHSDDTLREGLSLEMIDLASKVHWYRAKARDQGSDDPEFHFCASLMSRKIDSFTSPEFDKHYLCFLANEYLLQVSSGADDLEMQAAIEFASGVSEILYDVHPGLPALLANLAWTYQSRYEALGQLPDLDQAIDRARSSWELITNERPEKSAMRETLVRLLQTRLDEIGQENDSGEIARIKSGASSSTRNSSSLPNFKYNLKSLSISPVSFKAMIERSLSFPPGEELARHLSETKAGDLVVESALRRLDIGALAGVLVENGYSEFLAAPLSSEIGESIVFLFPLIDGSLAELNGKIASSAPGRGLWVSLASSETGRDLSASLLCKQWDWAFRTFAGMALDENAEKIIRALAKSEGGQELARLLIAGEGGLSFLRTMINEDRFLSLGYYLLDSGSSRELLADLCSSSAMEVLVGDLIAREDAEELLAGVLASRYFNEFLAPMANTGKLSELQEAITDSKKRSDLASRLAVKITGNDEAKKNVATLLLSSFLAPMLRTWLSSIGVAAAVEVVYIAAVIAVTQRSDGSGGEGTIPQSGDQTWIPLSTHQRPPQDSDVWIRVTGARLREGVPAVEPSDFEHLERLAAAVYDYMATKDLANRAPTDQDRILLRLANSWHLAEGNEDQSQAATDLVSKDRLVADDDPVDSETVQEAVRSALEGTPRDRWMRRFEGILIGLAATGVADVIAEVVARLMRLAPSADAQVYEVDRMLAQNMNRWRNAVREGTGDSQWTPDDEIALIFSIHALSLVTISGAYERRYIRRDQAVVSELVTPALRLNNEFSVIFAENLGMTVVDVNEIGPNESALVIVGHDHLRHYQQGDSESDGDGDGDGDKG